MANHQYHAADPSWEHVTPTRTAAAVGPVDAPFVAVAAAPPAALPTSPRTRAPPPLGLGLFASTADRAAVHHLTASALAGLRGSLRAVTSTTTKPSVRPVSPALSLASVSTDETSGMEAGSLHVDTAPAPPAELGPDAAARGPSTRTSWDPTVFVRTALKWVQPVATTNDTAHLDDASSSGTPRNASDWAVDVEWVSDTVRQGPAAPDFWTLVDSLTQHMAASADVAGKTHPGIESTLARAAPAANGSDLGQDEVDDDEDETSSLIDATMADVDDDESDSDSDHSMDDDAPPVAHDETPTTEHTPSASTPFSMLHAPSPAPAPPEPDLAPSHDPDVSASADLPTPPPLAHQTAATPRAPDMHLLQSPDLDPSTRPSTATSSWLSDADRRTTTSTLSASRTTTATATSDIDGSETVATHALRDRIQELEGFVARLMAESAASHAAQVALRDHAARLATTVKAQQVELDKFHAKWAKIREAVKRKRAARAAVGAGGGGAGAGGEQREEDDEEDLDE
ncbi:hypothetical protein GGF32_009630 [Allomyces javanicus]|nr:hypothetical protein GGF32_009630 [Allomyces javanicus]